MLAFRACWSDFILGFQATPFFIEIPFLWSLKEKGGTFDKFILPAMVNPSVKTSAIAPSVTDAVTAASPVTPPSAASASNTIAQPVSPARATLFGNGNNFSAFSPATGVSNG
jgi:hypothetical protein